MMSLAVSLSLLGSRVSSFGVTWRHRSREHFLLVVLWNRASISNSFRDIQ